ncbi:hypothetical protein GLOIN_2v1511678 [Rhizophagus irregularis DAOM 181602=DAOM 197198]|nr:hypothetical protein GLOIN_2v1511678 [Rhizophagus irregularis DAOM 181602=DAOM 197198]
MSNNDDRIQPNRSKDDTQVISMMDFGKEIKMIMENFKNCVKIEIKRSDIITENIKEVKKLQGVFREFVKESLDLNKQLEDYSRKIFFFTECFKDINYSNEEISKLLKSHLKDSKKNYELAKKLKNRLVNDDENVGIMSELSIIKDSTYNFTVDFENEIESDGREIVKYEGGTFYRICGEIGRMRKEVEMVKLFSKNLRSIIMGIGRIETFWDSQIGSIEHLIDNLKRLKSSSRERITQRQIVYNIEHKWKNVEKECQLYYFAMKKLLHENRYVK